MTFWDKISYSVVFKSYRYCNVFCDGMTVNMAVIAYQRRVSENILAL